MLCPGHTFTDHLAGSTKDQILRMTPEMPFSVVRYGCTTVWLRVFDVSTKDKIEKEPFNNSIDTVCYGLVRNVTV